MSGSGATEPTPEQSLAALHTARTRLALAQAHWPWSRHAAFAALIAALAAVQGAPLPFNVLGDALICCGAAVIMSTDRKRRGVFVNGWRAGRTLPLTLAVVALTVALGLLGLWLSRERGFAWAPLAIGAVLFPVGLLFSKAWEAIYRRELEEAA